MQTQVQATRSVRVMDIGHYVYEPYRSFPLYDSKDKSKTEGTQSAVFRLKEYFILSLAMRL